MIARRRSFSFIGLLSALTLCAVASQAAAATYDNLFVFGDSTVDSGWWSGALVGQCAGLATPCTTGNTAKDGLISSAIAAGGTPPANGAPVGAGFMNNVQDLAAKFGLTANPANQPGGTDYAISGALSAPANNVPPNPPSPQLGNLNPNTNLPFDHDADREFFVSAS